MLSKASAMAPIAAVSAVNIPTMPATATSPNITLPKPISLVRAPIAADSPANAATIPVKNAIDFIV